MTLRALVAAIVCNEKKKERKKNQLIICTATRARRVCCSSSSTPRAAAEVAKYTRLKKGTEDEEKTFLLLEGSPSGYTGIQGVCFEIIIVTVHRSISAIAARVGAIFCERPTDNFRQQLFGTEGMFNARRRFIKPLLIHTVVVWLGCCC